jgi:polyisoprenoid-binding protein YceI
MRPLFVAAVFALAAPSFAQTPGMPDATRVVAGTYKVDPAHTQVLWTVNHFGVSSLSGMFGATGGTLTLDPKNPNAAKLTVTFDTSAITVTSPAFAHHLSTPDLFDTAKFQTATFTSTSVVASGDTAKISGDLTIKGITKPITISAKFQGAGANPMTKKLNIGFHGTATIKRSDFGLGLLAPAVSDEVKLGIHGAFEGQ